MTNPRESLPEPPIMAPTETLPRGRRGFAVAALIAGILSLPIGYTLLVAPFAFVFGLLALRGDGMSRLLAWAGLFFATAAVLIALLPLLTVVDFG